VVPSRRIERAILQASLTMEMLFEFAHRQEQMMAAL
jgi:hypothetical protein